MAEPLLSPTCAGVCAKSLHSCLTLCNPMDGSSSGSSVHEILQTRILEWVAMPSSGGSSHPRDGMNPRLLCLLHWQGGSLPLPQPGKPLPSPSNPKPLAREGPKGTSEAAPLLIPPGTSSSLPSHLLYPAVSMVSRSLALGVDTKVVPSLPPPYPPSSFLPIFLVSIPGTENHGPITEMDPFWAGLG